MLSLKITEELCVLTLNGDANRLNFLVAYKVSAKKVQKSYLS